MRSLPTSLYASNIQQKPAVKKATTANKPAAKKTATAKPATKKAAAKPKTEKKAAVKKAPVKKVAAPKDVSHSSCRWLFASLTTYRPPLLSISPRSSPRLRAEESLRHPPRPRKQHPRRRPPQPRKQLQRRHKVFLTGSAFFWLFK